jgi:hypothetical protein
MLTLHNSDAHVPALDMADLAVIAVLFPYALLLLLGYTMPNAALMFTYARIALLHAQTQESY